MSKELTITKITAKGTKVSEVTGTINGATVTLKAWTGDITGWAVGQVAPIETEMRPGFNGGPEERWIKSPQKSRGGGGGAPKSDPAKNKVIEEASMRRAASMEVANTLNNSTTLVGLAVTLVGAKGDINQVECVAQQLGDIVLSLQKKLIGGTA